MSATPPFGYYAPPEAGGGALPAVIIAFRMYAAIMAFLYGVMVPMLFFIDKRAPGDDGRDFIDFVFIVPLLLAVLHAGAVFAPRRPWSWTFGVVTLAFGAMSCGLALAIPLLVFWFRPECKAAFRRF